MMAARIFGRIDESRFRQALATASQRHPLLCAKIIFDAGGEAWFSSQDVPPVPLRIIPRETETQWLDEMKETARIPFELCKGPLIRCVLLHSADVSDLLLFCNHSICDGMALAILIRDLLSLYTNPTQEARRLEPPDILLDQKTGSSLKGLVRRFFAESANRKWRRDPYFFGEEEYEALYRRYWQGRRPGLLLLDFDHEESIQLHKVCREHKITIGSAVSTACLAAHADVAGGFLKSQQVIMVPYDLRNRADPPVGDVFCFYNSGIRFSYDISAKKSFWENAQDLHREIHSRIERMDDTCLMLPEFEPSLIDAMSAFGTFAERVPEAYEGTEVLHRFVRDSGNVATIFNRKFEGNIPGFTSSNLGRIEVPSLLEGIRLDRLVFVPAASEINPLILGGVGTRNRIVFTLPFVEPPAKTGISREPEMIQIRNRMLEYLGFPEKVNGCTEG